MKGEKQEIFKIIHKLFITKMDVKQHKMFKKINIKVFRIFRVLSTRT